MLIFMNTLHCCSMDTSLHGRIAGWYVKLVGIIAVYTVLWRCCITTSSTSCIATLPCVVSDWYTIRWWRRQQKKTESISLSRQLIRWLHACSTTSRLVTSQFPFRDQHMAGWWSVGDLRSRTSRAVPEPLQSERPENRPMPRDMHQSTAAAGANMDFQKRPQSVFFRAEPASARSWRTPGAR